MPVVRKRSNGVGVWVQVRVVPEELRVGEVRPEYPVFEQDSCGKWVKVEESVVLAVPQVELRDLVRGRDD